MKVYIAQYRRERSQIPDTVSVHPSLDSAQRSMGEIWGSEISWVARGDLWEPVEKSIRIPVTRITLHYVQS